MTDGVVQLLIVMGETVIKVLPATFLLAVVFTVLSHFWACNPGRPWWRKRELVTDILYWFFIPVVARIVRINLMILGARLVFNINTPEGLVAFYDDGFGPMAKLPLPAQALLFLLLSDFMLYWSHRLFHGGGLWKYHAIHHSSEEVDWISAARFHPVNIFLGTVLIDTVLLLAGVSPNVMIWLGPFTIFHSAFVHANLNWTLGPLKYVIATPVFHRWHHTGVDEGGNKNFAGTFPVWDMLFGTFYMPADRMPAHYGADDPAIPTSFTGQLAYPFRASRPEEAPSAASS